MSTAGRVIRLGGRVSHLSDAVEIVMLYREAETYAPAHLDIPVGWRQVNWGRPNPYLVTLGIGGDTFAMRPLNEPVEWPYEYTVTNQYGNWQAGVYPSPGRAEGYSLWWVQPFFGQPAGAHHSSFVRDPAVEFNPNIAPPRWVEEGWQTIVTAEPVPIGVPQSNPFETLFPHLAPVNSPREFPSAPPMNWPREYPYSPFAPDHGTTQSPLPEGVPSRYSPSPRPRPVPDFKPDPLPQFVENPSPEAWSDLPPVVRTVPPTQTLTPTSVNPTNRPHNPVPPKKGEKETKAKMNAGASFVWHAVGHITEAQDFIDNVYEALPKSILRGAYKKYGRQPTPQEKLLLIYQNIEDVNLPEALVNYIKNQVEDAFYGKIGKALGKASKNANRPIGYGAGSALDGGGWVGPIGKVKGQ